ncbi:hypothetical protein ACVFYP_12285 [Roseomonas sp. F4]
MKNPRKLPSALLPPTGHPAFGLTHSIPLTEAEFAVIGKIATVWGAMEQSFDIALMLMIGSNNVWKYQVLTERAMFSTKMDMIKNMSEYTMDDSDFEKISAFVEKFKPVNFDRNHCIHGVWGHLIEGDAWIGVAAKSDKRPDKPFLASDLPLLLERVEDVARDASNLLPVLHPKLASIFRRKPTSVVFRKTQDPAKTRRSQRKHRRQNATQDRGEG